MPDKSTDHRPRVAAERRERMRRRLIESAMIVFADKGVGASIIPDVVAAAEVSQGSFYNYFRTNEDLLAAVGDELSGEMVQLIEPVVGGMPDAAARVATAIRCYLHLARAHRLLARFLAAAGLRLMVQHNATFRYLPADLEEGQKQGVFATVPLDIVLDLVAGTGMAALDRMARGRVPKDYPDQIAAALMRTLGMGVADAQRVASGPLPKLVPAADSLLARAQARVAAAPPAA
ncbi:TetR/AcrR family transcriptional regulator [Pseudoduganella namucuonensis]|uniref:Transcriptional regulator, TetR family n=1 Tax=Pseudoduganella namucuonensis TaxID=1035707 RepID=A0A1I7LMZ3_9BURK|nr:TetR/AcrR family transcriptional regulator [Pseudoduganella namucuonensis]SFV11039.1 transcriptional regulator, TetR family [Pseudoduganella namucuonensis]